MALCLVDREKVNNQISKDMEKQRRNSTVQCTGSQGEGEFPKTICLRALIPQSVFSPFSSLTNFPYSTQKSYFVIYVRIWISCAKPIN